MTKSVEVEYKLVDGTQEGKKATQTSRCRYLRLGLYTLSAIFLLSGAIAGLRAWSEYGKQSLLYPPRSSDIPSWWYKRAAVYARHIQNADNYSHDFRIYKNPRRYQHGLRKPTTIAVDERKLVCYYAMPDPLAKFDKLRLKDIDPFLCTHINVGIVDVVNNSLAITDDLNLLFNETSGLKAKNQKLKILIWAGGADSRGFVEMVRNHANRKEFIQSLKATLRKYSLDGIDLDWEFPSAYNKERQHFSQLLYEIRKEYQRERRDYLLTIAAAAPEGIAFYAYDIREINEYADFVNIMTYDYHFYSKVTPFTGLNAPLYARTNEYSILSTLNINYSVNYWYTKGLDKSKIVVGLPTYGHSFRLQNPYNHGLISPANNYGNVGTMGFASYSEICWFKQNNIYVTTVYDTETCSPYLYSGLEWISFEDERSLACKTKFIKDNNFGGAMLFSLNTDDFGIHCIPETGAGQAVNKSASFPLIRKVRSILFDKD